MTLKEFQDTQEDLRREADTIASMKRPDYTIGATDVLANFKNAARMAGITPMQAWLVHVEKQLSAVTRHILNPDKPISEPIKSRFCDLHNYLDLGYALMLDTIYREGARVLWTEQPLTATAPKDVFGNPL